MVPVPAGRISPLRFEGKFRVLGTSTTPHPTYPLAQNSFFCDPERSGQFRSGKRLLGTDDQGRCVKGI